ncbi:MAG: HAMP domain-containing sensor histidine kinase, partial [Deltaproteobacteria bacterium]
AGDLSGPLVLDQHDEIAEFAVEMNAMCDRLAGAQHKLEAETTARIDAIEQLRHADRLRTVGQLASGIAHELGTPLNVVLGRARMIAAGDATPDERVDNARIIADQAQRMTTLIRQLLDFARPRGPQFQTLDLRDIARATADMLAPLADKRRVKILFAPPPGPVEADVDPTQTQQALTNLVMNAVQAMGDRGGTVSIEVGAQTTQPPADLGGDERSFRFVRVRDDGEGIDRVNLARIFEPFFTTKAVGDGTGLGLSVAYGIVRDHGGWIDVESEPAHGSTFTLYVPAQRSSSAPATPRISQGLLDGSPHAAVIR